MSTTSLNAPNVSRSETNLAAARIGPTVWELDGPIPTENSSNTLMVMRAPLPFPRFGCQTSSRA